MVPALRSGGDETSPAARATAGQRERTSRMVGDFGEGGEGAEAEGAVRVDAGEARQPAQADDDPGRELPALHVRVEVGPARDRHRLRAVVSQDASRLGDGSGRPVLERRQPHHRAHHRGGEPRCAGSSGGTITTSGYWKSGMRGAR